MASDLIDSILPEHKFRIPSHLVRQAVDESKYGEHDEQFRCAKCKRPFVYDDEVWAIDCGNEGEFIGDQYTQHNHYDCEVANK